MAARSVCTLCSQVLGPLEEISIADHIQKIQKFLVDEINLDKFQTCRSCHDTLLNLKYILKVLCTYKQDADCDIKEKIEPLDSFETNEGYIPPIGFDISNENHEICNDYNSEDIDIKPTIEKEPEVLKDTSANENTCSEEVKSKGQLLVQLLKQESHRSKNDKVKSNDDGDSTTSTTNNETRKETVGNQPNAKSKDADNSPECETKGDTDSNQPNAKSNDADNSPEGETKGETDRENIPNESRQIRKKSKRQKSVSVNLKNIKWYRCAKCSYKSQYNQVLQRHMVKHKSPDEIIWYNCKVCNTLFKDQYYFRDHVRIHTNPNEVKWQCPKCSFFFSRSQFVGQKLNQEERDQTERYKCIICDYKATSRMSIASHMTLHKNEHKKTHENVGIKMYKCYHCQYQTKERRNFKAHYRTKHVDPKHINFYKCLHCSYQTIRKDGLVSHMMTHSKPHSEICCQHCSYKTYNINNLRNHNKYHHTDPKDVKWHKCTFCSYQTRRPFLLRQHFKNNHA